ncbi:MAG: hypothetical protein KAY82_05985 [Hylemonella sp.]|nr:hypothetical protein [Hylemonella sp.]
MNNQIQNAYINALLADAAYAKLNASSELVTRMTQGIRGQISITTMQNNSCIRRNRLLRLALTVH